MKLQTFVQLNSGKSLFSGGDFRYDRVILSVSSVSGKVIDVVMVIPMPTVNDITILQRVDIGDIDTKEGELVGFYRWLKAQFFPTVEGYVRKVLKKKDSS